ncbi:MAG: imidazole glycerol phosphate synthase subunit HisH [Firmicutes bacterium]|nr:imidazole glycerol phosphate synthase subunit HisH [Bacillota bacterium]
MIAIIDYGVGNLFSLKSSLESCGIEAKVTGDPREIRASDRIILPGVGAFEDAIAKLRADGLDKVVVEQAQEGKPLMGICLGMQLLFDVSHEFGLHKGLGLIPGDCVPIADVIPAGLKIPHVGWNALRFTQKYSPIFKDVKDGDSVYFVHSYYCANCEKDVTAVTEYGADLTASVRRGNVFGCQFHPEKSGPVGMKILKAFDEVQGA